MVVLCLGNVLCGSVNSRWTLVDLRFALKVIFIFKKSVVFFLFALYGCSVFFNVCRQHDPVQKGLVNHSSFSDHHKTVVLY